MPANIPPTAAALALVQRLKIEGTDGSRSDAYALAQAETALTFVSLLTYYEIADPTREQARILGIEASLSMEAEAMK